MPQFVRGDAILVLGHMYGRLITFRSGVMLCRSVVNGVSLGKTLSKVSDNNFPTVGSTIQATEGRLKAINTSCQALGRALETAKFAQTSYFDLINHFGLSSLFVSITPDDLCSFRVRLYLDSTKSVSFLDM